MLRLLKNQKKLDNYRTPIIIPIRGHIESMNNLSAHPDCQEIVNWLKNFKKPLHQVFIVQEDPEAQITLKIQIEEKNGLEMLHSGISRNNNFVIG